MPVAAADGQLTFVNYPGTLYGTLTAINDNGVAGLRGPAYRLIYEVSPHHVLIQGGGPKGPPDRRCRSNSMAMCCRG